MPTVAITRSVTVGGVVLTSSTSRTEEALIQQSITLAAGKSGDVSSDGIDGLATGHGIEATDIIDVHWTVSGVNYVRYGITVDSDDTNAITFDSSPTPGGTAMPAEDTVVIACVQQDLEADVDMSDVKTVIILSDQIAHLAFTSDDPVVQLGVKAKANIVWIWNEGDGIDNPFTGETDDVLDKIAVSNGSVTAGTLQFALLYDSTG